MPNNPTALVAANLRAELGRADISGVQLAQALGVSQAWVSRRITGSTPLDVEDLVSIADVLDVPVSRLTDGLDVPAGAA
jgi:transcriptional regulator with XRE-family HTH domain